MKYMQCAHKTYAMRTWNTCNALMKYVQCAHEIRAMRSWNTCNSHIKYMKYAHETRAMHTYTWNGLLKHVKKSLSKQPGSECTTRKLTILRRMLGSRVVAKQANKIAAKTSSCVTGACQEIQSFLAGDRQQLCIALCAVRHCLGVRQFYALLVIVWAESDLVTINRPSSHHVTALMLCNTHYKCQYMYYFPAILGKMGPLCCCTLHFR